jgi:hypothetical protein
MSDRLAAGRPPAITNLSSRTRRAAIGTAAVIPALLVGLFASTGSAAPKDSGLVACAYPLTTQDVPRSRVHGTPGRVRRLALPGPAQRRNGLRRSGRAATHGAGHRRIRDRLVLPAAVRRLRQARREALTLNGRKHWSSGTERSSPPLLKPQPTADRAPGRQGASLVK